MQTFFYLFQYRSKWKLWGLLQKFIRVLFSDWILFQRFQIPEWHVQRTVLVNVGVVL